MLHRFTSCGFVIMMVVCGCVRAPLRTVRELRYYDSALGGFSKRIVDYSGLVHDGQQLYFGTNKGGLICLSAKTGKKLWQVGLVGGIGGRPWVDEDYVCVGTSKGRCYCLQKGSGKVVWEKQVRGEVLGQPQTDGEGHVLFGTNDGLLYALDRKTGEMRWKVQRDIVRAMTIHVFVSPMSRKGIVYAAFSDGAVVALRSETGDVVWSYVLPTSQRFPDVTSFALVAEKQLLAGQLDGSLFALSMEGKTLWSLTGGGSAAVPIMAKNDLIVPGSNNRIMAVDPQSGRKKWTFEAKEISRWSGVALCGSTLLATTFEGMMFVLSLSNGQLLWTYDFGSPTIGPPVVHEGIIWTLTQKASLLGLSFREKS